MEYTVVIHAAVEGGFWAEVPALPGCFSQGESIQETLEHAREAIEAHLAALREDNEEIPVEEPIIGTVRIAVFAENVGIDRSGDENKKQARG